MFGGVGDSGDACQIEAQFNGRALELFFKLGNGRHERARTDYTEDKQRC